MPHDPMGRGKPNLRESGMIQVMADRSRLATERMSVSIVRAEQGLGRTRVTFCALEGSVLVLIEADSEDDAHAICDEQGLEFHSLCED